MKIVKTYLYSHLAHLDLAKLSDEGINAFIKDDNIVAVDPVFAHAVGWIKLLVRDEDYERARRVLDKNDFDDLKNEFAEEEIESLKKCPACGSINLFQKGSWLYGLIFLLFFFVPFTFKKKKHKCLDCSNEWKE